MPKKAAATPEPTSPVAIDVSIADGFVVATVKYDGTPVEGAVQWWPGTAYQPAREGTARMSLADPREFALTAARRGPRPPMRITARVKVDDTDVYSDPVEVDPNQGGK